MTRFYTILLIDDDAEDRQIFLDAVEQTDPAINCLTAEEGGDALTLLENLETLPDIIFLDLNMPGLDGKQFLQARAQIDRLTSIPVVIYSTTRRTEDVEETKALGASNFITKPNSFKGICKSVFEVLRETGGYSKET